jgi:spore maturation protein CgeB
LKSIIKKLLTEENFYIDVAEQSYENFINKYSFEQYINQIIPILNTINEL